MKPSTFLLRWQQRKRAQKIRLVSFFSLFFFVTFGVMHWLYRHPASFSASFSDELLPSSSGGLRDESRPLQEGVRSLAERRKITEEYCTSSKVFKDNGAWCLRDRKPPQEFAPGHRFSTQHVVADKHFVMMLMKLLGDADIVDLGAGLGQYGVRFEQLGRKGKYTAFDGAVNTEDFTNNYVRYADLTKPLRNPGSWVISFEVGEHIPKQHEMSYVSNLVKNAMEGLVLSWAVVRQGGHGHVNERDNVDVVSQMEGMGFIYDSEASNMLRREVRDHGSKHLRNTTMLFRRKVDLPGVNTW